ncbi:MAG: hypothetical protein O2973_06375 [Gemmatimonadetes bacterium]|nr:hypothetical protein [Gemmatimonadota bacterium]
MKMIRRIAHASVAAAIAAGLATSAGAQGVYNERAGMTASIGVGAGTAGLSCVPKCKGDRLSGPVLLIRGAANVAPQLTIALEANLFNASFPIANGTGGWALSWVTLNAQWYPKAEENFFIKAGAGLGLVRAHATFPEVGALDMHANSVGLVVGIGRDFRLTSKMGVSIYADYMSTTRSVGLIAEADSGARLSADVISIGLAAFIF